MAAELGSAYWGGQSMMMTPCCRRRGRAWLSSSSRPISRTSKGGAMAWVLERHSEAEPWGSRSSSRTSAPSVAKAWARLMAMVVLPQPPFWLHTAMMAMMFACNAMMLWTYEARLAGRHELLQLNSTSVSGVSRVQRVPVLLSTRTFPTAGDPLSSRGTDADAPCGAGKTGVRFSSFREIMPPQVEDGVQEAGPGGV